MRNVHHRDLVVIGASAGGIEAVSRVLRDLPIDFPAAVCVALHLAPRGHGQLLALLGRRTQLPVHWGEHGAPLEPSHVYVAPTDMHMMLVDSRVELSQGARENHARPSIDKLFRSAAATHGGRAIGVLLTGMLTDGVAGLAAIQRAGGTVIIHDPMDARFGDLPSNALDTLTPDRMLPVDAIGSALVELTREHIPPVRVPEAIALEGSLDRATARSHVLTELGRQTTLVCPDCGGPMWQLPDPTPRRYRCYLGHALDAKGMLDATSTQLESALWTAVRVLDDRTRVFETLARDATDRGDKAAAAELESQRRFAQDQAELVWNLMFERILPKT